MRMTFLNMFVGISITVMLTCSAEHVSAEYVKLTDIVTLSKSSERLNKKLINGCHAIYEVRIPPGKYAGLNAFLARLPSSDGWACHNSGDVYFLAGGSSVNFVVSVISTRKLPKFVYEFKEPVADKGVMFDKGNFEGIIRGILEENSFPDRGLVYENVGDFVSSNFPFSGHSKAVYGFVLNDTNEEQKVYFTVAAEDTSLSIAKGMLGFIIDSFSGRGSASKLFDNMERVGTTFMSLEMGDDINEYAKKMGANEFKRLVKNQIKQALRENNICESNAGDKLCGYFLDVGVSTYYVAAPSVHIRISE